MGHVNETNMRMKKMKTCLRFTQFHSLRTEKELLNIMKESTNFNEKSDLELEQHSFVSTSTAH